MDKELEARELLFTHYANDCVILVASSKVVDRGMTSVSRFIEKKLGLKANMTKSKVSKSNNIKYFGFGFFRDGTEGLWKAKLHEKSVDGSEQSTLTTKHCAPHPQAWAGVRLPWSCASSHPLFCLFYNLTNGFVYEMVKLCRTRNQLCYQWCVNIKSGIQLMLWNPFQDLTPRRTQFPKWDVWSETTSEKSLFY